MLSANKIKALAAIKRLQGLTKKVEELIETDAYCIEILRNTLALKGHIANIQAEILDSHLHTCAETKLASSSKEEFITELLQVIELTKR